MSHLAVFVPCLLGFAALALATQRQQEEQLAGELPASTTRALRIAGWTALLAGGVVAVCAQGWALGLVSYSGHTSLCAGIVFAVLVARKRRRESVLQPANCAVSDDNRVQPPPKAR